MRRWIFNYTNAYTHMLQNMIIHSCIHIYIYLANVAQGKAHCVTWKMLLMAEEPWASCKMCPRAVNLQHARQQVSRALDENKSTF